MALSLRLLGGFELSDGSGRRGYIPVQPKPAAILSYVAVATPRFQRRDTLLALFWPELDADHARGALSKAVHYLRRSLGDGVLEGRGDEELGLVPGAIRIDVVAFQEGLAAGRLEQALAEYRGELLAGFHCSGAPDFERWLDRERPRLSGAACAGALALSDSFAGAGDAIRAVHWSRRATELGVYDESAARHLIRVLAWAGDHAGAIVAYREFERRLADELDTEPSAETRALAESLRHGGGPAPDRGADTARATPGAAVAHGDGAEPARAGALDRPPAPGGIGRPAQASRPRWLARRATTPALAAAAALAGFVALRLGVATPRATEAGTAPVPPYSVAVLPFTERVTTRGSEYLAFGATEELTNAMARVPGLLVSAAPAASMFGGESVSLREIGRQLRVSSLVAGTIDRVGGGGLRLAIQLTRASNGAHLWRRTYDVSDEALPAVYASAAREIRNALAPDSSGGQSEAGPPASRTANPRAYQSYLLGLYEVQKRSPEGAKAAIAYFERATREDSGYADAFAALAMAHARRSIYSEGSAREERIAGVTAAADRALALDSTSPGAWTALGMSRFLDQWDWRGAEAAFRRAVALNPNHGTAYNFYSQLLVATGRPREGEAALEQMRALDPVTSGTSTTYGLVLYYLRRYDESAQVLQRVVEGDSTYENGFGFLTRPLLMVGRERELAAVLQYQLARRGWPTSSEAVTVAAAVADPARAAVARRVLDRWESAARPPFGAVQQARIRSRLGDRDRTIELLELAYRTRVPGIYSIAADPAFDLLRSEPRFRALVEAMGLSVAR